MTALEEDSPRVFSQGLGSLLSFVLCVSGRKVIAERVFSVSSVLFLYVADSCHLPISSS